jgi:hypothetical protein
VPAVEFYVDPSCPWAWVTAEWIRRVAPYRALDITWKSYCLEIRDDYDVAPTVPESRRDRVIASHALSHRMLRIFEAVRETPDGEEKIDRLYLEWGPRFFRRDALPGDELLAACLDACGLERSLLSAADEDTWDEPIVESMEIAYELVGPKTQTPALVVRADPPQGFKGPVMASAPTGDDALHMWDALMTLTSHSSFFEITRQRVEAPRISPR